MEWPILWSELRGKGFSFFIVMNKAASFNSCTWIEKNQHYCIKLPVVIIGLFQLQWLTSANFNGNDMWSEGEWIQNISATLSFPVPLSHVPSRASDTQYGNIKQSCLLRLIIYILYITLIFFCSQNLTCIFLIFVC